MGQRSEIQDGSVEAGLLMLEIITPYGVTWTQEEIAFVCGCTRGNIWDIERSAMRKLRQPSRASRLREFYEQTKSA